MPAVARPKAGHSPIRQRSIESRPRPPPGPRKSADADAAAVVDRDPGGPAGGVDEGVEQRPVGDGVGAVEHRLGLAVGRRDRAAVEVVAADHDRGLELPGGHRAR